MEDEQATFVPMLHRWFGRENSRDFAHDNLMASELVFSDAA